MTQPSSLILVDADLHGLETLTYGFEREGCKVTRTSDLSRAVQLSRNGSPALAVVMLREPTQPALDVIAVLHGIHRKMPILALGDASLQTAARAAGASDFLRTPTFIRDVVTVAKLSAYGDDGEGLLSEYHGLFYILRAMSAIGRSGMLRLARGPRRAEIRFKDGKVVSATVRALQHLPALHHLLLWEEARVAITGGAISKPSQFPLSAQEVLDECERFLRDFGHAARDLGPPNTVYQPVAEPRPAVAGLQPSQMAPLLRLFDGKRGLADVVEESPFRIFDTIRMIRRLVEGGVLSTNPGRRPTGPQRRISRPVAPLNGAAQQSMLGQWAMVPDQRGVVGDRRSKSRPLMPFGPGLLDQPGTGRDRRRPSQPFKPFATPGPTPLPTPAPIPLTHKKQPTGEIVAKGELAARDEVAPEIAPGIARMNGETVAKIEIAAEAEPPPPKVEIAAETEPPPPKVEIAAETEPPPPKVEVAGETELPAKVEIPPVAELPAAPVAEDAPPPVKRRPTPAGDAAIFALEPTLQVKVDKDGTPLAMPPTRRSTPAPVAALELPPTRRSTPAPVATLEHVTEPPRAVRTSKTPIPARVTPAAAFDAVEADFFAREADLYKREAVETFEDLDPGNGSDNRPSKNRRRRK
jgi:CheY-like chemotaxis protein